MRDLSETQKELRDIIREESYRTGEFTLASGKTSHHYFNLKTTMLHPMGAKLIGNEMDDWCFDLRPDFVCGMEMGAVPLLSLIASGSIYAGKNVRGLFVRKKVKEHGSKARIEGLLDLEKLNGATVVLVDDVSTSGGSLIETLDVLRPYGVVIEHAITVVDREEGAIEALAQHGVKLHSLLTLQDFLV